MSLRIFSTVGTDYNASNWYRTILPLRTAAKFKLAMPLIDFYDRIYPFDNEIRTHAVLNADIIQHYQNFSEGFRRSSLQAAQMPSYWTKPNEEWSVPPHFVLDTDDDMFNVLPLNPAFRTMGWKVNGAPIQRGMRITVEMGDGKVQDLYQDGADGFDIERNVLHLNSFRENLAAAALVTVSTNRAADYVRREVMAQNNIHVFPNCIDFADYPKVDLADRPEEVRILWAGADNHLEDLWPLQEQIARIHAKYTNVKLILFGALYDWFTNRLDPDRVEHIKWVDYPLYKLRMSVLGHDIVLAPLHDALFNQSRSGIKQYESAACWKPAACLAQRTGAYQDEIIERKTGMLFSTPEEFELKLSELIEDRSLRTSIASNAKDWVRANRDPAIHVPQLLARYQALRDARLMVSVAPPLLVETPDGFVSADQPDIRKCEDADRPAGLEAVNDGDAQPSGPVPPASGEVLEQVQLALVPEAGS